MRNRTIKLYRKGDQQRRHPSAIKVAIAPLLLGIGTLFAQVARFFNNLGRKCGVTAQTSTAIDFMRCGRTDLHVPAWEQGLLRVGPWLVIGVCSALGLVWLLLLLGGALVWFVLHGYGLILMLGAVVTGAIFGIRRAGLSQQLPRTDRLN